MVNTRRVVLGLPAAALTFSLSLGGDDARDLFTKTFNPALVHEPSWRGVRSAAFCPLSRDAAKAHDRLQPVLSKCAWMRPLASRRPSTT